MAKWEESWNLRFIPFGPGKLATGVSTVHSQFLLPALRFESQPPASLSGEWGGDSDPANGLTLDAVENGRAGIIEGWDRLSQGNGLP